MSKGHILVVEDNLDNYELVRTILGLADYDTFLAVNGRDGVTAARKQKPDLILMDMSLPEMDGWNATKLIRQDPETAHIPMIALTVHTLPIERQRALDAGVDAYLPKPYDAGQLIRLVEGTLKNSKQKKKKN
ncbi:MAG: response regulator [Anaerolineales bacterium]|jgi:CheY-like chemotaxis protein